MKATLNIGFIDKRDFINRRIQKEDTMNHNFHFFSYKTDFTYIIKSLILIKFLYGFLLKNYRFLETLSKDTDYYASMRHFKVRRYIEYA